MKPEDKEPLRERIIDQMVETKSRIADLEEITKPIAPDQALGRLTRLDGMLDKSVNEAALARLRNDLVQLQNAMVNVMKPSFGLCQSCGEPISMARMEGDPAEHAVHRMRLNREYFQICRQIVIALHARGGNISLIHHEQPRI